MAHPINGIYNGPTMATATNMVKAAGGGDTSANSSSIGSGGKAGEAISALKNELAGDDEDDSATENGKCHTSAKYFWGSQVRSALIVDFVTHRKGILNLSKSMQPHMESNIKIKWVHYSTVRVSTVRRVIVCSFSPRFVQGHEPCLQTWPKWIVNELAVDAFN